MVYSVNILNYRDFLVLLQDCCSFVHKKRKNPNACKKFFLQYAKEGLPYHFEDRYL